MTPKEEYLNSLVANNALYEQMKRGAELVQIGGIEGIKFAAKEAPEMILEAIAGLAALVDKTREEHLKLVEDHFAFMDQIGI